MIPKVNKALLDPELIADEQLFKARPEWFKFFYAAWFISTQSMDDMQRGWYIQLLSWAATEGDPPGYLPADEHELKNIAGMDALPGWLSTVIAAGVDVPSSLIKQIITERETKWKKVRKKFIPDADDPDFVYNPRLLRALQDAYRYRQRASEIGKEGAISRWGKGKRKKRIMADAKDGNAALSEEKDRDKNVETKPESQMLGNNAVNGASQQLLGNALGNANKNISLSLPIEDNDDLGLEDLVLREIVVERRSALSLEEDPEEEEEENGSQGVNEETSRVKGSRSRKKKRSGKTIFDPDLWEVTPRMISHLMIKYEGEGIEQGDIDYLSEKFAMTRDNLQYSRWSMAFYNFVDNQLTKYGYEFGMYKRRGRKRDERRQGLLPDPGTADQSNRQIKPWESGPERTARLDTEAEELARRLRSGSLGDRPVGTPGRALAADSDD